MVSSEGGERMDAYCMKNKRMTMAIPPSSPSLVNLHHLVATSLNVTCTHLPVRSFAAPGLWECLSLSFVGAVCHLTVVRGILVVCVIAGWSLAFVGLSFVGCWPLLSSVHVVIELWSGGSSFGAGVVCGGGSCQTWHADNKEGTHVVVDAGDVAMWLSDLCVRQ